MVLVILAQPTDDLARGPGRPTFRQNVRAARRSRGWTQEDLAREAGLAAVQVSRLERGACEVRLTTLLRLVSALGVRPDELLDGLY